MGESNNFSTVPSGTYVPSVPHITFIYVVAKEVFQAECGSFSLNGIATTVSSISQQQKESSLKVYWNTTYVHIDVMDGTLYHG